jgi:hypothetical protein
VLKLVFTALTAIALIAVALTSEREAVAQEGADVTLEVRVIARPNEGGSIEFAVEYESERYLPSGRRLTPELADSRRGEWLSSTPVEVVGPSRQPLALLGGEEYRDSDNQWETPHFGRAVEVVRVHARPLFDGRVEFALSHNGESYLPETRYLTQRLVEERAGTWLRSSPISLPTLNVLPADYVRHYSETYHAERERATHWADKEDRPPLDVARVCTLTEVRDVTSIVLSTNYRDGYTYGNAVLDSAENLSLYGGQNYRDQVDHSYPMVLFLIGEGADHFNWIAADHYGFVVEAERYGRSTIWWLAEFACAEDAPTGNIEPADNGAGGSLE